MALVDIAGCGGMVQTDGYGRYFLNLTYEQFKNAHLTTDYKAFYEYWLIEQTELETHFPYELFKYRQRFADEMMNQWIQEHLENKSVSN